MPTVDRSGGVGLLALNHNIRVLVLEVFRGTEAYRRTERSMKAAMGALRTSRSEDAQVESRLRRARLLTNQGKELAAEAEVRQLVAEFPARADVHGTLAWINKKAGEFATARLNFQRAVDLGCKDRDTFWHWSEMEAANGEWKASSDAARLGVAKFPGDQGLLFRLGYALHRQGKELILEDDSLVGVKLCREAQGILDNALAMRTSEDRNFSLRNQIFRAITLNLEILDEGKALARCIAEWQKECPNDPCGETEYQRLRQKYPQFLRAH
jgi:hypothetical protein